MEKRDTMPNGELVPEGLDFLHLVCEQENKFLNHTYEDERDLNVAKAFIRVQGKKFSSSPRCHNGKF